MVSDSSDGSDKRKRITPLETFFCILAALGCCAIIYATGGALGVETGRNQVNAREHYEQAKKGALESCIGRKDAALMECVTKAAESAHEESVSRQDLYAQQDVAGSTFWMMVLTFGTLLVTGAGVFFVKRTLEETVEVVKESGKATKAMNDANEIAGKTLEQVREMAKVELQPYVFVERIEMVRSTTHPEMASLTAILKNYGLTPALYVSPMIGWEILDYPLTKRPTHFGMEAETISEIAPQQEMPVPYPLKESMIGECVWSGVKNGKALIVHVTAHYENRIDTLSVSWNGFYIFDGPEKGFRRLAMFNDEKLGGFKAT